MTRASKAGFALLCGAAFLFCGLQPASARCELIVATNSAGSKTAAAQAAYANAIDTANQLRRKFGWSYVNMTPRKVTPDPFWKAVRPSVSTGMLLKPDIVTAKTYAQCWRGVVVPYVCTAGAVACGN
jgi:hypothetical protein